MKVLDIIKQASNLLNLSDYISYLNSEIESDDNIEETQNNMLIAVNMTNNNLAVNYINLIDKIELVNDSDKIKFLDISNKNILEIKSIKTPSGKKKKFKVCTDGIEVEKSDLIIEYSYFPDSLSIDDEIDYYNINELIFSLGVVSEYLFLIGSVDDAYMWDKKFKQNLASMLRPTRNIVIPERRWY